VPELGPTVVEAQISSLERGVLDDGINARAAAQVALDSVHDGHDNIGGSHGLECPVFASHGDPGMVRTRHGLDGHRGEGLKHRPVVVPGTQLSPDVCDNAANSAGLK
jgi:hypothetical protein